MLSERKKDDIYAMEASAKAAWQSGAAKREGGKWAAAPR
jgi:hypothetical protein